MFSFFRRRKPISLGLLEREPVAPDVAGAESALSKPEQEEPAVAEWKPEDPPATPSESDDFVAKSTPAELAPSVASVSNLYAIPNAGVKFAIEQKMPEKPAVETGRNSASPRDENVAEMPIATDGDTTAEESVVNEVIADTDVSVPQSVPGETVTEVEGDLDSPAAEVLPEESIPDQEAGAGGDLVAIEELAAEAPPSAVTDIADTLPSEVAATDSVLTETSAESVPIKTAASDATEIESSGSGEAAPDVAHRLAELEETVRQKVSAEPSKRKRSWWSFWRKRQSVEKTAAESSAFENSAAGATDGTSAVDAIALVEQVTAEPFASTDSSVDAPPAEPIVSESSASQISMAISATESDAHNAADIELPPDSPVPDEVAGVESQPEAPSLDVAGIEPTAVEPQPEEIPEAPDSSEITKPENQATEVAEVGNPSTTEESDALEDVQVESATNETEQIALPRDAEPIGSSAAENVAEAGTAETPLTESVGVGSEFHDPIPGPAVPEPPSSALETVAELASFEVSGQEDAIPSAAHDESAGDRPVVEEEEVAASVAEAHEDTRSSLQPINQSNHSSGGLLNLQRVAEPEVMDDSQEVEAYTSATAQAWLDKIDDSFVDHAARLVKGRQRGRALDIGTGPGQIALKLALRLSLWKVIGVDRSQKMIDEARAKLAATAPVTGRLEFRVADGNRLDFPDASFDLVICNSVLHHFAEPRNLLAELARVTKPRGAILLRDLRRPSRLMYPFHVRWHGRHYEGAMGKLYRDSVRAAYTLPELQRLLDSSPLRGAGVFRHGSTHIGLERPYS